MKAKLSASRKAVERAGGATRYLLGVAVILMVALAAAFSYLSHRQRTLEESVREDALWAVYQLDRETRTLLHALSSWRFDPDEGAHDLASLVLRYDILYSRLSILDNSKYATTFEGSKEFEAHRVAIRSAVLGLEPTFNSMAAGTAPADRDMARVAAELAALGARTEDFLSFTNSAVSAARADARNEVMRLQELTAMVVAGIGLTILILIINLMHQLRLVRTASLQLESTASVLTDAHAAAEAGNRAKSEFMATIGHEIRTPLNAILGVGELLSESNLEPEDRENVRIILNSGNALLEIINEILDFAKLEHGDTLRDEVVFDVRELVDGVASVMEGRVRDQRNRLDVDLSRARAGWRRGDPARIRRVLLNLVSNAVKFTKDGSVVIRVVDDIDARADSVRFEVEDTGIGIPPDSLHRLFQAFSQVDGSISRRYGGTGLGLAICKKLVEGLNGKIGVESMPGRGSVFWFEIPSAVAEAETVDPSPAPATATNALRPLKVLLVEDNLVNRQVASSFLARLGQTVITAADGVQAVARAREPGIDLILMDMQMPVLDGIAATRQIRAAETGRRVPIIAMTANASERDKQLCAEAGMDGFEPKPVSMARLAEILAAHGAAAGTAAPATTAAPEPGATPAVVVDHDRLAELVAAVGQEGYDALAEMFFQDTGALMADLKRSLASSNLELYDRTLHSLTGSAGNLGFNAFAAVAERLRNERLDPTAPDTIGWELDRLADGRVGSDLARAA